MFSIADNNNIFSLHFSSKRGVVNQYMMTVRIVNIVFVSIIIFDSGIIMYFPVYWLDILLLS